VSEHTIACPYCGEPLSIDVDPSGGRRQVYVEDCAVCCRPMEIRAAVDDDEIDVEVRTLDE
jgi:hypothetical protein